ncbi:MAG: zf-HC2 domain-containing protein [Planctomycetes bacterium]|nr:zf-HC2 domain-containing protein [Planctomycetota bacterium]
MAGRLEHYEQLTAYLDGELTEAERAEVEQLLARDAEARELLEELRETARLIGSVPKEFAGMGFNEAVRARLERSSLLDEGPTRRMSGWKPVALAASLVIVCTIGYFGMEQLQKERERQVFALADKEERGRPVLKSPTDDTALAFRDSRGQAVMQEQVATGARRDAKDGRAELGMKKQAAPVSGGTLVGSSAESPKAAPAFGIEKADENAVMKDAFDDDSASAARPTSAAQPMKAAHSLAPAPRLVTSKPSSQPASSQPTSQPATSQPATEKPRE